MTNCLKKFDKCFISEMHHWGIPVLRITLGIVFVWFGILKILNVSPAAPILAATYWFFPQEILLPLLGVWECLIGIGFLARRCLRIAIALLWFQMLGIFIALFLYPPMFFTNTLFLLTFEGEFVIKNIVLIAASLVIGGYEISTKKS